MMKLIEGNHYRRRHEQPTPEPHKSKVAVDCMLCSDPGDDDNAPSGHVARKRSRPIGQNIRLDRFHVHLIKPITRMLVVMEPGAYYNWAAL
jgi:hypothetical protein